MIFRIPLICVALLTCSQAMKVAGQEYLSDEVNVLEGYLEPAKNIEVSSVETGIIDSIHVGEGDVVRRGQILVRLNREVLEKSLEVAKAESDAVGSLKTAKAELQLQEKRYQILKEIFDKGHGRKSELERAKADVEIAKGRLLRAQEDILIRKKQLIQIKAKLAVRDIVSPIDGIVTVLHKNPGEAVSPSNPVLITVVNIDQLKCVFNVPRTTAMAIRNNQTVLLTTDNESQIKGIVQWKSPIVHADSETVKVIVRIDNSEHVYTSGEHCVLNPPAIRTSNAKLERGNRSVSLRKSLGRVYDNK